jgi:hypothetical protein
MKQDYTTPLFIIGAFAVLFYLHKLHTKNAITANVSYVIKDCGTDLT